MWVTAEYADEASAARAVSTLADAGFDGDSVEVFSARPAPEIEARHPRSRASLMAAGGAILNGGAATAFIRYTQHDYPLTTGGMPLYSSWATGVITFELTMAGAVAGLVIAFLLESGLFRRRGPAPRPKDGAVFVRVRCSRESSARASDILNQGKRS